MSGGFRATRPAIPTVMVDTAAVRVTRFDFEPGAETGFHRHAMTYVVVPLTDGVLRIEDADGTREAPLVSGVAYSREAGVEHNVINAGDRALAFVEIEIR